MSAGRDGSLSRRDVLGAITGLAVAGSVSADMVGAAGPQPLPPGSPWPVDVEPDLEGVQEGQVLPAKTVEFIDSVAARLSRLSPEEIARHARDLGRSDDEWRRRKCISLRAAEGLMSAAAQRTLDSYTATRVSEGFPAVKSGSGKGTDRYIDELEATIIYLARQLFRAKYVEWRPISNTMANALALLTLTEPGDVVLGQAMGAGGGNAAYHERGPGALRNLRFVDLPYRGHYEVDADATRKLAREVRPKLIFIGGSWVLFPYPVRELRAIADEVGAVLVYDAAHLALLISAGQFQQPFEEGAHIFTMSSHKSFGGPVGGLTLTNDAPLGAKMLSRTLNGFVQTRDANKLVATAYTLAEVIKHGAAHATQMLSNVRTFGEALDRGEGFTVIGRERGYSATHQIIIDVRGIGSRVAIERCLDCNILVQGARLPGDETAPSGLRLSVAEGTRLGMKEPDMARIARFMRRAISGESAERVGPEIERFLEPFQRVHFGID
jgi:glycine hydroxymethyltransferase